MFGSYILTVLQSTKVMRHSLAYLKKLRIVACMQERKAKYGDIIRTSSSPPYLNGCFPRENS